MTLGKRIAQLREQNNWSQEEFGAKIGKSRSAVSLWEAGTRNPDIEILAEIAQIFEVSTDYLLKGTEHAGGDGLDKQWPEVVQVLRRAGTKPTETERKHIAEIIRVVMKQDGGDK